MFVGHYSAAFVAKALDSRIPLWVLFLAVQLVDVGWALLVLAGVEKLRVIPGFMAASPLDLYYMPYTHSLLAAFVWAGAGLLLYRSLRRSDWRAATWVGAAVLSHWFLDLPVHAADLPLWDDAHKVGFGLWDHALASYLLEAGILAAAIWLFVRRAEPAPRLRRGVLVFGAVLAAVQAFNTFGPAPHSAGRVVGMALAAYLTFAGVAAWLERREA